ncbi:MAG: ABC transporter substrate-binding protein [Lentisphaerae bacterium]|nr:ABC transporter substrate-binding protein [Lentisphaerota bacterium]
MNAWYRHPLLTLLLLCGAPALALAGVPTDQLRQTTDKILAIVQDPAMKGPEQDRARQAQMDLVVDERFDWASMARSALGNHWKELTDAQRTEFTDLFSELVEKTYMTKVESYSGEKILYKGDKVEGTYGVVDVAIVTLRGTDIPVSYRMLQKGPAWLVYDVSIEGVSLVNNYRSQVGAILGSSSYDVLVARLKTKIASRAPVPDAPKDEPPAATPVPAKDVL